MCVSTSRRRERNKMKRSNQLECINLLWKSWRRKAINSDTAWLCLNRKYDCVLYRCACNIITSHYGCLLICAVMLLLSSHTCFPSIHRQEILVAWHHRKPTFCGFFIILFLWMKREGLVWWMKIDFGVWRVCERATVQRAHTFVCCCL